MEALNQTGSKIVAGPGMRVTHLPGVEILAARPPAWKWDCAWAVRYGGSYVTVGFGLVNGIEPTVKGVPISGGPVGRANQPKLDLPAENGYDEEGRAWVVLEVHPGEDGKIASGKDGFAQNDAATVKIRTDAGESDWPETEDVGLCALAVIHKTGRVHQIQHFHLNYRRVRPGSDVSKYKQYHLFW